MTSISICSKEQFRDLNDWMEMVLFFVTKALQLGNRASNTIALIELKARTYGINGYDNAYVRKRQFSRQQDILSSATITYRAIARWTGPEPSRCAQV